MTTTGKPNKSKTKETAPCTIIQWRSESVACEKLRDTLSSHHLCYRHLPEPAVKKSRVEVGLEVLYVGQGRVIVSQALSSRLHQCNVVGVNSLL